ncbi:hypothetical protein LY76DRAFT_371386 [Colletotrichum caudatum]|nr:hypothetical protein LY76DRAFT_371386 [Colletotrichum caudatum]
MAVAMLQRSGLLALCPPPSLAFLPRSSLLFSKSAVSRDDDRLSTSGVDREKLADSGVGALGKFPDSAEGTALARWPMTLDTSRTRNNTLPSRLLCHVFGLHEPLDRTRLRRRFGLCYLRLTPQSRERLVLSPNVRLQSAEGTQGSSERPRL